MGEHGACYLTDGLNSIREIPDSSVDLIWSQAVLEHIYLDEIPVLLAEFRRILKPDGKMSHRIDLQDHLSWALNNLRFSQNIWESRLFRESGFYTNRLRYSDMMRMFEENGFKPAVTRVDRWGELPTPRTKLATPFQSYDKDDLLIKGFNVVLTGA